MTFTKQMSASEGLICLKTLHLLGPPKLHPPQIYISPPPP